MDGMATRHPCNLDSGGPCRNDVAWEARTLRITVVPAGKAGTQAPCMIGLRSIPAIWIPAVHAGMTA
jgi:hypothetical protein